MSTVMFLVSSICITSLKTFNSKNKSKPLISMEFLYVRALSRQRHLSFKLSLSNDFNFSKLNRQPKSSSYIWNCSNLCSIDEIAWLTINKK